MISYDNKNQNIEIHDLIPFAMFYTKYETTKIKADWGREGGDKYIMLQFHKYRKQMF